MQDTLHHIPDEVLDASPKRCNIPDWRPSSDMPSPAKRRRADSSQHDEAVLAALQANQGEATAEHPPSSVETANVGVLENSTQDQDRVLLEKGDCAAAAPVAA